MTKTRLGQRMRLWAIALFGALALAGCGEQMEFPVSEAAQRDLPPNLHIQRVSMKNIDRLRSVYYTPQAARTGAPPPSPSRYTYRVGTGDQLRIQVWTTPERQAGTSDQLLQPTEGPVVDETGHFFYPFVGQVRARGRTLGQIRTELTEQLRNYLRDPQVEVAVQEFRAQRVMITGAVGAAGPTTLTNVPMHLIDLINIAGVDSDSDLSRVALRRRGVDYPINVQAFLEKGDLRQNPLLLPDDAVYVPPLTGNQIFVFGEIQTTEVPIENGSKSLTEVLAEVGGIDRVRANAEGIFVFRRTDVTNQGFDVVFQFDLSDAENLLVMNRFPLVAQDIVFVTTAPATRWTDTVGRVLAPARSIADANRVVDQF